jgi:uncharacterized protein involved in outer membrane biogenesis
MSRSTKIVLRSIGSLLTLLVLIAVALVYFVDADVYKPHLQAATSKALGMEVSIDGRLGIGFYPGMSLKINDVHIHNRGKELVVAEDVRIGLELLPLLQNEYRITHISLTHPKITIELDHDGRYNFEQPQTSGATIPAFGLAKLALSGGTFVYADKQSGGRFAAADCNINLRNMLIAGAGTDIMKNISFTGELLCGKIKTKDYTASDLKLTANAKNGVFNFKPVSIRIFGGQGSGDMQTDYSGASPLYHVRFALPQFRIEQLLKTESPETIAAGPMDFSMDLSLQGKSAQQMKQSASGDVALQGKNLKLNGHNLDLEFSRFESSQNFNLLDVGAFFIAGPVGMAATKGYDFANVLKGSGGVSDIRTFVSSWKVERGVMHAKDVAMATNKYRMALLGGIDIAHERFVDVTLALINHKGCAEVQQRINGPFDKPVVEQPGILKSVAGPMLKLFKRGRKLLPGSGCDVIYTGTVAAPR